jgi:chemotaxis protein CheY-P-specific phosphatase CheC
MALDTQHESLLRTLVDALDTMAFIASEPTDPSAVACPELPVRVTMHFGGPINGTVELVTAAFFGRYVAANVIGSTPDDPEAAERAPDALKEVVNVVVGALMPRIARSPDDLFTLSIPELDDFDPSGWTQFVSGEQTFVAMADGYTVAVRMTTRV